MTTSGGAPPLDPVTKDQTGPAVEPPLETAVTFQKYVVAPASVPGVNDVAVRLGAACGGGVAVPNATLWVVPLPPPVHESTGPVLTPVAPLDGFGFDGAGGAVGVP